jgi:hypothetical protein
MSKRTLPAHEPSAWEKITAADVQPGDLITLGRARRRVERVRTVHDTIEVTTTTGHLFLRPELEVFRHTGATS